MNRKIVGPIGLTAFALCVSGCDGHNNLVPSANVSVFVQSSAPIDNVQDLTLQIEPALMYVECSTGGCPYYALIADDDSVDRSYASTDTDICRDVVTGSVNGVATIERRCDTPVKTLRVIDMSITSAPLGPAPIVRHGRVPETFLRRYSGVQLQVQSTVNVRDSYVHLADGRECEINVVFPEGALFPLNNFTISNRDEWNITLMLDFTGTVIDPTRCETPQDVYIRPTTADVQKIAGFTWSNHRMMLAGYTWSDLGGRGDQRYV
jgi:hypothetical protein